MTSRPGSRQTARGGYLFFVSYAHTPPADGADEPDADVWVGEFFSDLSDAVAARAGRTGARTGFIDRDMAAGSDWRDYLASALGEAEVFVPLYAPRYFANKAAGREWTIFQARLDRAGAHRPDRYLPVLWIPLPPGYPLPETARLPRELDEVPDYRENGLQALCRLPRFREPYRRVVSKLADRIVEVAATRSIEPSTVPDIDDTDLVFPRNRVDPQFVIAVAAKSAEPTAPAGYYGPKGTDWRPFGRSEKLPLSAYAATIAERFRFTPVVTDLDAAAEHLDSAPGIVLIDPWLADDEHAAILRTVEDLPLWTLPIVVASGSDPRLARAEPDRIGRIKAALAQVRPGRTEAARRAAGAIASLADFDALFPILVTDAARRYLIKAQVYPPRGPVDPGRARPAAPDSSGKHSDD